MRDFCYIAIEAVPAKWRFTRGAGAFLSNPDARPLLETHIPPILGRGAGREAFTAPPETASYFQQLHKGLAMAFSCQEA